MTDSTQNPLSVARSSPWLRARKMSVNLPKTEEEVLRYWREIDAFQTQLRLSQGQPRFTFYDGPPFGASPAEK